MILAVLSIFALLFVSLGVGWWIGEALHNMLAGFSIIAGFYVLSVLVILAFKKQIVPSIQNIIIRKAYEEDNNIVSGPDRTEVGIKEAA